MWSPCVCYDISYTATSLSRLPKTNSGLPALKSSSLSNSENVAQLVASFSDNGSLVSFLIPEPCVLRLHYSGVKWRNRKYCTKQLHVSVLTPRFLVIHCYWWITGANWTNLPITGLSIPFENGDIIIGLKIRRSSPLRHLCFEDF